MNNWLHIFIAGTLFGIGLIILGALLAHACIYFI
jgi:hypothetical protein